MCTVRHLPPLQWLCLECTLHSTAVAVQHEALTNDDDGTGGTDRRAPYRESHNAEMARGFSLFEEALLGFEVQDVNTEWYLKAAAAIQNTIQCYWVIFDKKQRATPQTSLSHFFKRVDRIESSNEPEPVPSTPSVSETAACPPSPAADNPSASPSSTPLLPLVGNPSCLSSLDASPCMPGVVLNYCTFQGTVL